jgi:hypothetical protein
MSASPAQLEVAAAAARLIAEDGLDYAAAKRKAAVALGLERNRQALPDNDLVESEVRRYLHTFEADEHRQRLLALRRKALSLMQAMSRFDPHLVGAVLSGAATRHSDIHLHLFTDNPKEVEMFLLDRSIRFDVDEGQTRVGGAVEVVQFVSVDREPGREASRIGVVLSVHDVDAIRVAPARPRDPTLHPIEASGRADQKALHTLLTHMAGEASP